MNIIELKYSSTNTYIIQGDKGCILFDTGLAGTFGSFLRELGEKGLKAQNIDYILISHFHPDHMGIAELIAELGPKIMIADFQKDFVHGYDDVIMRDPHTEFKPVDDSKVVCASAESMAEILCKLGINSHIFHTPGHSDDSLSLLVNGEYLFVGDLNPLYELELHKGTEIGKSWDMLLSYSPAVVYYGHAKAAILREVNISQAPAVEISPQERASDDLCKLVSRIMKYIDKGYSIDKIHKKTKADITFINDVARMYLTHQNVSVQGILDRIEIKGR